MRHKWWYWGAFAVTVAAVLYALYSYSAIPDPMPVHWNASGEADGFRQKTTAVVVFSVVLGPAIVMLVGIIAAATTARACDENKKQDVDEAKRLVMINDLTQPILARFTFLLTAVLALDTAFVTVQGGTMLNFWLLLAAIVAISVYVMVGCGRAVQKANITYPPTHFNAKALKGGMFYWDAEDSRTIIQLNENGSSMTFNFARPGAWAIMLGLSVPIILIIALAIVAG